MGGNIWKDQSIRLPLTEYLQVQQEIVEYLGADKVKIITYMKGKDSFGDLDLVVDCAYRQKITNTLKEANYIINSNGDVVSFLYKDFQVDLIFTPKHLMEFASSYFSNNDVGNILGRIAKQLGLKYGHQGLFYVHRSLNRDRILSETLLTLDIFAIYDILKVPRKLLTDSPSKLEAFKLISESPYFNKEIFKFENLNHQNKVRDRKRATYKEFLDFCDTLPDKLTYNFDKQSIVCYLYPHIIDVIHNDLKRLATSELYNFHFNGERLKTITGYENQALGYFIKSFKGTYSFEYLLSLINNTNNDPMCDNSHTLQFIKDFHEQYIAAIMSSP